MLRSHISPPSITQAAGLELSYPHDGKGRPKRSAVATIKSKPTVSMLAFGEMLEVDELRDEPLVRQRVQRERALLARSSPHGHPPLQKPARSPRAALWALYEELSRRVGADEGWRRCSHAFPRVPTLHTAPAVQVWAITMQDDTQYAFKARDAEACTAWVSSVRERLDGLTWSGGKGQYSSVRELAEAQVLVHL